MWKIQLLCAWNANSFMCKKKKEKEKEKWSMINDWIYVFEKWWTWNLFLIFNILDWATPHFFEVIFTMKVIFSAITQHTSDSVMPVFCYPLLSYIFVLPSYVTNDLFCDWYGITILLLFNLSFISLLGLFFKFSYW